ncbi:MAG: hypothetical protein WCJ35_26790 [Planctomycetota bacterium]
MKRLLEIFDYNRYVKNAKRLFIHAVKEENAEGVSRAIEIAMEAIPLPQGRKRKASRVAQGC